MRLIDSSTQRQGLEAVKSGHGNWAGFRNRFWAVAARSDREQARWSYATPNGADYAAWQTPLTSGTTMSIYAGPLAPTELSTADPILKRLVFDGLWFWMRWLCLGLLALLDTLHSALGSWGIAIIALSVVVKIAVSPLTMIARRWQRDVNAVQSKLQPEIDAIKRQYTGEEQANRILAAHKALGVSPFYTLKTTLGFLIQIPVLIAAFAVLNSAIGLNGAGFLWINDLSQPDALLTLPFPVPFLGTHFNLLPALMTALTLTAVWFIHDDTLPQALITTKRRNLTMMAMLFFVLFYTFPAGSVLFWTVNALLQLLFDTTRQYYRTDSAPRVL